MRFLEIVIKKRDGSDTSAKELTAWMSRESTDFKAIVI